MGINQKPRSGLHRSLLASEKSVFRRLNINGRSVRPRPSKNQRQRPVPRQKQPRLRHEFFRTRIEADMWFDTGIFEDKEEREVFFVTPAMREALVGEIRPVILVPTITRSVLLLWPLK
jgi:hypothetical protein